MRALLLKEFRLVVHPSTYVMVALGSLVLIPNWPYAVILLYGVLTAFFNAQNAREMHDLSYSFALPISRADMVRVRVLVMVLIEVALVGIMALGLVARSILGIDEIALSQPMVGLPANVALLGCSLAALGIFNAAFFPLYYRDPNKIGVPFLLACIPFFIFCALFEAIPYLPGDVFAALSVLGFANAGVQISALCVGVVIFALLSTLAVHCARSVFVDFDA